MRWDTPFLSNKEKELWIEDSVNRVTYVARKRVRDAETVMMQQQEDMRNAQKVGSTTRKPVIQFEEMLYAIKDSPSIHASADDEEDREDDADNENDPELGTMSNDDKPGWVMGASSKTAQQCMGRFC